MSRARFVAVSLFLDALLVNAGFVLAFVVRFKGDLPSFNFGAYVGLAPLITVLYLGCGYIYGLYEPERTENGWSVVRAVVAAMTLGTLMTAAVSFFAGPRFFSFSRLVIVMSWIGNNGLLVMWRLFFLRFGSVRWPDQRVLIVGTGELALELARELCSRERWGYRVIGLLRGSDSTGEFDVPDPPRDSDFAILGTTEDVTTVVAEQNVDRVIVVSPMNLRELVERLTLADEVGVRVDVVPELYEIFIGTVDALVGDIPLMEITRSSVPPYYAAAKRAIDVLGAILLLLLLSPVLVFSAVTVLLTMGRPVFFTQERTGRDLAPFRIVKFRTMVNDAEKTTGPVLASDDDPRITRFGRFMRRYRIDELPQLINIVAGSMSFVGPRPERPFFVEQYLRGITGYRERFKVKPGVTGLAQVSGGYATTPERKLKYDLIYMYHQNLAMDAQIVLETLRVVLTGRGAR